MKRHRVDLSRICLSVALIVSASGLCCGQDSEVIHIHKEADVPGLTPPIPVSLEGFSGEALEILKFDLYVQGFAFVAPDVAQYQISGGNIGNVQGHVVDRISKNALLSRGYTGADLRRQAHAFADDVVLAITGKKGIAQLRGSMAKIAFKVQARSGNGEIYVADFDGHSPQAVTTDGVIVARPAWVPGHLALYYNSYKLNNPDIFYHDLTTGRRRVIAH